MIKEKSNNDEDLVYALKHGDVEAFDKIFKKYCDKLFYFAEGILKSKSDAEEIIQQVFIKVWEKRSDINESLSFKSYLFTITHNTIISFFRKRASEQDYLNNLKANFQFNQATTDHLLEFNELNELVDAAISKLPPKRKLVYELSRKKGLSNQEIAKQLNVSKNTVENQLTQALKFLREQLRTHSLPALLFYVLFI